MCTCTCVSQSYSENHRSDALNQSVPMSLHTDDEFRVTKESNRFFSCVTIQGQQLHLHFFLLMTSDI